MWKPKLIASVVPVIGWDGRVSLWFVFVCSSFRLSSDSSCLSANKYYSNTILASPSVGRPKQNLYQSVQRLGTIQVGHGASLGRNPRVQPDLCPVLGPRFDGVPTHDMSRRENLERNGLSGLCEHDDNRGTLSEHTDRFALGKLYPLLRTGTTISLRHELTPTHTTRCGCRSFPFISHYFCRRSTR